MDFFGSNFASFGYVVQCNPNQRMHPWERVNVDIATLLFANRKCGIIIQRHDLFCKIMKYAKADNSSFFLPKSSVPISSKPLLEALHGFSELRQKQHKALSCNK